MYLTATNNISLSQWLLSVDYSHHRSSLSKLDQYACFKFGEERSWATSPYFSVIFSLYINDSKLSQAYMCSSCWLEAAQQNYWPCSDLGPWLLETVDLSGDDSSRTERRSVKIQSPSISVSIHH